MPVPLSSKTHFRNSCSIAANDIESLFSKSSRRRCSHSSKNNSMKIYVCEKIHRRNYKAISAYQILSFVPEKFARFFVELSSVWNKFGDYRPQIWLKIYSISIQRNSRSIQSTIRLEHTPYLSYPFENFSFGMYFFQSHSCPIGNLIQILLETGMGYNEKLNPFYESCDDFDKTE